MPTVIKPLDEDVSTFLDGFIEATYLDGQCYEFAVALHRGLNWDLVGLLQTVNDEVVVRHAAVRHPDGGFFDGRGKVSKREFVRPFGPGEIITFRLESELKHRTRSITERNITLAGNLAMSRWPELPWNKDTYFKKVMGFVDDLEQLCRHHGFWICGQYPTSWPMIVRGHDDEAGYALATVGNGSYTMNRVLNGEVHGSSRDDPGLVRYPGESSDSEGFLSDESEDLGDSGAYSANFTE
jgi:hypothetical protein